MLNKLLAALMFLWFSPVSSQWQTISKQSYTGAHFLNDTVGFSFSNVSGTLQRTTDGGYNWTNLFIPANAWEALTFSDENNGHIFNSEPIPIYWRTSDGGKTWIDKSASFPNQSGATNADFPVVDTGYAGAVFNLYKTVDNGNSWVQVFYNSNFILHSLNFFSADTGFMAGKLFAQNYLFKTVDGGLSWDSLQIPMTISSSIKIEVISSQSIYAISSNVVGEILYTNDGGQSWSKQLVDSSYLFTDICFPTPDTGYVTGLEHISGCTFFGLLLKTTDGGQSWQKLPTFYFDVLYDSFFLNGYHGWVTGRFGNLLRTSNGGEKNIALFENHIITKKWHVYPNPANNYVIIANTESSSQQKKLQVYNSTGQLIPVAFTTSRQGFVLDTQHLAPGIYYFSVGADAKSNSASRFIIE